MGILLKKYDFERNTVEHKAFLRTIYESLNIKVAITAGLKLDGNYLYMLIINERVNESTG